MVTMTEAKLRAALVWVARDSMVATFAAKVRGGKYSVGIVVPYGPHIAQPCIYQHGVDTTAVATMSPGGRTLTIVIYGEYFRSTLKSGLPREFWRTAGDDH